MIAVALLGAVACGDANAVAEIDAPATTTTSAVTTTGDGDTTTAAVPEGSSDDSGGDDVTGGDAPPTREPDDPTPPGPAFVEVTAAAGLDVHPGPTVGAPACILDDLSDPTQSGDWCIPQRFLGAAAVADFDGDGLPDVYLSRKDGPDRLMKADGLGGFSDVAGQVGISVPSATGAAAWLDADDDGHLDLLVTTFGGRRHRLFIADGRGHFDEQGAARGLALEGTAPIAGMGVAAGDYDLDGYVDLFVAEWRPRAEMGRGRHHNRLLRNRGAEAPGYFEDVTADHEIALGHLPALVDVEDGAYGFGPAFVDLDGDGWPELTLTADFGTSRLYWNEQGTFVDGTWPAGVGTERNGMGSTFGDVDRDGDLDWFVSAIATDEFPELGHRMYLYAGDRTFVEAQDAYGLREPGWGWSASLFDHDLDGDLDLAMASGWDGLGYDEDPLMLWEDEGELPWSDRAAALGVAYPGQGRGLVAFDYDVDGDQDLLVVGNARAPALFRNDGADGQWLKVQAQGTTSNRQGLGAVVRVWRDGDGVPQVRHIGARGDHLFGQEPAIAHFGLGALAGPVSRVTVTWPASGTVHEYVDVAPDAVLVDVE